MCCSLRGAAFFGASIHIGLGLLLFLRYVIATVVFTFYNFNDLFKERVTGFIAPFMIYISLLLALAVLIFHSIEKEYFYLLKWSTVALLVLQVFVFLTMLSLKLSPHYRYRNFPFLPASLAREPIYTDTLDPLLQSHPHHHHSQEQFRDGQLQPTFSPLPQGDGGGVDYLLPLSQVKSGVSGRTTTSKTTTANMKDAGRGATGARKDVESPEKDNITQGGGGMEWWRWRSGEEAWLSEVYRIVVVSIYALLTTIYLTILFLYIRQLDLDDPDHVFGQAQAVTRNVAFYVQPQFAVGTSKTGDNKFTAQLQATPPTQHKQIGIGAASQQTYPGVPQHPGVQQTSDSVKASEQQPPAPPPPPLKSSLVSVPRHHAMSAAKETSEHHATVQFAGLKPSGGQPYEFSRPHPPQPQLQMHVPHRQLPIRRPHPPVDSHNHPNYIKFEQIRQQEQQQQERLFEDLRDSELTHLYRDARGLRPFSRDIDDIGGLPLPQTHIQQVEGTPQSTSASEPTTSDETSCCGTGVGGVGGVGAYQRNLSQLYQNQYRVTPRTSLERYLLPYSRYPYDYPLDSSMTQSLLSRHPYRNSFLSSYVSRLPSYNSNPYRYSWWARNRSHSYTGWSDSLSSLSLSSILLHSNASSPNLSYIPSHHSCFSSLRVKSKHPSMV